MYHDITCERVPGSPLPYFLSSSEPGNKASSESHGKSMWSDPIQASMLVTMGGAQQYDKDAMNALVAVFPT